MTKRQEQKEFRRNEILMIALDLFVRKGYGSTKVADIVKGADISMGLLFHYFGTKEQLYHELLKIGIDTINFELNIEDSPIETFENILKTIFDMLIHHPDTGKIFVLLGDAFRNDGIPNESKALVSEIDTVTKSAVLIKKGQDIGEIRQGDPFALALAFWDAIQGIAERIAVNPEMPVPEVEWILSIIKKQ